MVCEVVDGLVLEDYLDALTTIVDPYDITFASRISHNRICIYLKSLQLADKVSLSPPLPHKGATIRFRKYVTGTTRVFLSNAIPDIPLQVLHDQLAVYGKLVGPITHQKPSNRKTKYPHILGFRRLANMEVENLATLPTSISVSHAGTSYNVYLNLDDYTCSSCLRTGHHEARCQTGQFRGHPSGPNTIGEATEEVVPTTVIPSDPCTTGVQSSTAEPTQAPTSPDPHHKTTDMTSGTVDIPHTCVEPAAVFPREREGEADLIEAMDTNETIQRAGKRGLVSPVGSSSKRYATLDPANLGDEESTTGSDDSDVSEDEKVSPNVSDAETTTFSDTVFIQSMKDLKNKIKAGKRVAYLLDKNVDPDAFLKRVESKYRQMSGKERSSGDGKRYATLIAQLKAEINS